MKISSICNVAGKRAVIIITLLLPLLFVTTNVFAQDPDFYIYLCFGQSNMEGQGDIDSIDQVVDSRFQVMEAVNCSNLGRTKGSWYTAVPPLCRCNTGLSPADYFGKMMVANLPDSIKVGVINVSVAGCKIELFDKDSYTQYVETIKDDWLINIINEYNGNPYAYLVDVAKMAQQDGVIKGFLLHQGESNQNDTNWPSKVKGVYNNLITDLELDPDSIPLLAGEVVHADQGGATASMNSIIAALPDTLPNSYVVSSRGCKDKADNLHFTSAGYREIGIRYGIKMLAVMGADTSNLVYPEIPVVPEGSEATYYELECAIVGSNWDIVQNVLASNGNYVTVKSGIESVEAAPTDSSGFIYIPFEVDTSGDFNIYARLNCPSYNDDSYWVKVDNNDYTMANSLVTSGWQWMNLGSFALIKGSHTLAVAYREDGALLDKICISNYADPPDGMGEEAVNLCDITDVSILYEVPQEYSLAQNYPNPFNPTTTIKYTIQTPPKSSPLLNLPAGRQGGNTEVGFVQLRIYNMLGQEVATLVNKQQPAGNYEVKFDATNFSSGVYYYQLKAGEFNNVRKMILIK